MENSVAILLIRPKSLRDPRVELAPFRNRQSSEHRRKRRAAPASSSARRRSEEINVCCRIGHDADQVAGKPHHAIGPLGESWRAADYFSNFVRAV
jgi:hypothetical protein